MALGLAGCASQPGTAVSRIGTETGSTSAAAYHKISGEEAKKRMDEEAITILDVRTAQEYAEAHIPDAVNLPNEDIGEEPPKLLPDKDAALLVYCRSGRRSKEAADKLVAMGYTQVYDFGGITDWPYETMQS